MRRLTVLILAAAALLALPGPALGSTQTFTTRQSEINPPTANMGWWSPTLSNSNGNPTYSTGWFREGVNLTDHQLRSYFTFKLDGLCGNPQSVALELTRQNDADKGNVTLGLFDVSTDATTLASKDSNPNAGIFADLGSGTPYGSVTVDTNANDPAQVLQIPLNAAALAGLKGASGQYFSIGGALTDPADGFVIGTGTIALFEAGAGGTQQLVVTCIDPAPSNLTAPSVSGTAAAGSVLTCDRGTWSSVPTSFATVWLRDGAPIPGATGDTYTLTDADQGAAICCRVVASSNGGDSPPVTSAGVTVPKPTPTPTPTVVAPKPVAITTIATLPPSKVCVSRRKFPIRLRGVKAGRIVRAQIKLNGKQVRNVTGKALGLPIDLRGLPKGTFTVQIVTTDAAGKKLVGKRTYRTCVPKKR